MSLKKSVNESVWEIAEPIAADLGLLLWDVRFVKEGGSYYLRLFIDRENGNIGIEDCVKMSEAIDKPLDELDPIDVQYSLQVSSPGAERELTRDFQFKKYIDNKILVKLIRPYENKRTHECVLKDYDRGMITVLLENGSSLCFERKEASKITTVFDFENALRNNLKQGETNNE